MNPEIEVEAFLEHHGVKGMHWGVRNERKSGNGKVGMSDEETQLAIYGGVIAVAILAHVGKKIAVFRDSGRREAKQTGDKAFKKNIALKQKMSISVLHSKVVKPINPHYGDRGTKMNCRRATLAYEMRRRGYDVKATPSKYASGQDIKGLKSSINIDEHTKFESVWGQKEIFKNDFFSHPSTPQKKAELVFSSLAKNPNGARGELGVSWVMGGGHSMAWEIVNKKPVIFDTQNGKTYDTSKSFSKFTPAMGDAAMTRLDNKSINNEFIKRWVTDV